MSESGESSGSVPATPFTGLPDTARPFRFTWDPANRLPGPESVAGTTTDGKGDYFATKLGDFQFNASSTNLALAPEWSSSRHGFHAISTVLNNPHKRQAPPKAHSALPTIPPAELPRVRRKDFDPYIRAIAPEWERFEHHTNSQENEAGPSTPRASISSLPTVGKMTPLDSVPPVFFEHDFNLTDPKIFATVTEDSDPTALSHSLPLLEKFSHYTDTIEMHLTHEISLRSSSFFAALSNLHHLQSESAACLSQISELRKLLEDVDEGVAKQGLQIVRLERKMQNLAKVEEGIQGIKETVDMTGVARNLVSAGQWGDALGIVEDLTGMWEGTSDSIPTPRANGLPPIIQEEDFPPSKLPLTIPVASLHAFSELPSHLRNLTMEIVESLSSDLVNVLRVDLQSRIEGHGGSSGIKDRLSPLLEELVRTSGLKDAILSWRDIVLVDVKDIVGTYFSAFNSSEEKPTSSPPLQNGNTSGTRPLLSAHLRTLSHSSFMIEISAIYEALLNALEGLQSQGAAIGELLEAIQRLKYPSQAPDLQAELTDILSSAGEVSHVEAAKIISFRSEQHSALQLSEFVEYFNESWTFVVKCEVVCRRMIVGLRGVIVGQAKNFLQAFHQIRLNRSAKLVEDEQWSPEEISATIQHAADIIVESAVRDSQELVMKTVLTLSPLVTDTNGSSFHPPHSPSAPSKPPPAKTGSKHLRIEERTYFIVPATAEVLTLILDYLRVIVNLSMLTTDTMSRVIEFFKAFNSRTCQVVLGAGAMRSAGLKNITAKHLALASQSLSVMIALIPYVRETFRRHLNPKQAVILVEFDKLKRDFQEHQNEIHAKLIAIMGDRLSAHIKSLQAVDWSVSKAGGGVNDYMELLVKETVTLHKVLSRYLSAAVVEDVMAQVFAAINHRLSEEYNKIELPHAEAKTRLVADAKFLHQKLSSLKNVGAPTAMLETVAAEKSVPRAPSPMLPKRMSSLMSPGPNSAGSNTSQRLRGLLSGRSVSAEKPLPSPVQASAPDRIDMPTNGSKSPDSPLPPPPSSEENVEAEPPSGYKQVEISSDHLASPEHPPPIQEEEPRISDNIGLNGGPTISMDNLGQVVKETGTASS